MNEQFDANRANWDDRAVLHAARDGSGYAVDRYVEDRELLSDVVRFDIPLLPDVDGLRGVHLQCHIGTDTLSLARRGARMTGLDFSGEAIAAARLLVAETGDDVRYVEGNVYDAATVLDGETFDFVFTGIGALGWLPDVRGWARVVASVLKPGGFLFIREGHPVLFTVDERRADDVHLHYSYWEHDEPLVFDDDSTYVDVTAPIEHARTYEWNHGLGEIVTALIDAGLRIDLLVEHDSVPWEALPGQMVERDNGEFALADRPERMPLSYTLRATRV
ncbi:class I SAM-dependent methyltransferase [Microbacterium gorillae]|uniref:class I SAM-dependent methyltransferase n=1 Tax=Microbacterium gorillae TaxID=1231063 RepID=UPI003D97E663